MSTKIITTPYERPRSDITKILNQHKLHGIGVEIGVKKGLFSKTLLDNWDCKQLFLIDPWCEQDKTVYDETMHDHSQDLEDCKALLKDYTSKYEIIREYSHHAHRHFDDESIDFIYIDGNHSYDAVLNDLELWYPKLVKNGIMSGDDYTIRPIDNVFDCTFGVKKAVDEFALRHKRNVSTDLIGEWYYTGDGYLYPSRNWYFVK